MTDANIEFFLQFIQIEDKDRLLADPGLRVKAQMDSALDTIKQEMVEFDKHID